MTLEHFALGTPVRVAESYPLYGDWARDLLWIAGVGVRLGSQDVLYTVSSAWPPRHFGDLTDGFQQQHLTERLEGSLEEKKPTDFKELTDVEILEMVEAARQVGSPMARQVALLGAALLKSRHLVHIRERMMASSKMYWVRAGEKALAGDARELANRVAAAKEPAVMAVLSRLADTHNNVDSAAETVHGAGRNETGEL